MVYVNVVRGARPELAEVRIFFFYWSVDVLIGCSVANKVLVFERSGQARARERFLQLGDICTFFGRCTFHRLRVVCLYPSFRTTLSSGNRAPGGTIYL